MASLVQTISLTPLQRLAATSGLSREFSSIGLAQAFLNMPDLPLVNPLRIGTDGEVQKYIAIAVHRKSDRIWEPSFRPNPKGDGSRSR